MEAMAWLIFRGYFYPRPPRGGRPWLVSGDVFAVVFLSTPSARRATPFWCLLSLDDVISIHALREEGDLPQAQGGAAWHYFYPRPPRGGRLGDLSELAASIKISIHALREEGDAGLPPTAKTAP